MILAVMIKIGRIVMMAEACRKLVSQIYNREPRATHDCPSSQHPSAVLLDLQPLDVDVGHRQTQEKPDTRHAT